MKFQQLQDNLRRVLLERIEAGQLTGLKLAHETGFQQAHISNFLNRKRGLSLEGMDKVMVSQKLSVLDLLDRAEINKRASIPPPPEEGFENVLLVDFATAANDVVITNEKVRDILKFKHAFLRRLKSDMQTPREQWTRFVLARIGNDTSMAPRILPGATILIDRHYNSLKPYRKGEPNMYAVRKDGVCTLKYVELTGSTLILRPHNQAHPVDIITVEAGKNCADYIVGRICYIAVET
ncbi:MAG: helix-turn-helix transcriptional regulator [Terriglobales bacterium]